MSSFGVLLTGFGVKTVTDILTEVEGDEKALISPALNTLPSSVLGQLNGIQANQLAAVWEALLAVYTAQSPDGASAAALDNIAALTGITRLPASRSTVTLALNVGAGIAVPAGSVAGLGTLGARFVITGDADNSAGAFDTNIAVPAQAFDFGPTAASVGAVDTIRTPVTGWSAKHAVTNLGIAPYTIAAAETLLVKVDGQASVQTVAFAGTETTAADVATAIDAGLTGAGAVAVGSFVRIESDLAGTGSAIEITGGTANPTLGFEVRPSKGFNIDTMTTLTSANAEPYALVNGDTLFVEVDGGAPITVVFNTGDFVAIGAALAHEVADVIQQDVAAAAAYNNNSAVSIQSRTVGTASSVHVTGGTANAALGFSTTIVTGQPTNAAILGRDIETDASLRLRRLQRLSQAGNRTVDAIRAAILGVDNVSETFVFENNTGVTDPDGRPPHSIEVVANGGTDAGVAAAIFSTKAAGIDSFAHPSNPVTETVIDSQGIGHTIRFSRPVSVAVTIDISVTADNGLYASTAPVIAALKTSLTTAGNALLIGQDVILESLKAVAFDTPGIIDVTSFLLNAAAANVIITPRQQAVFTEATVNVTVLLAAVP